MGDDALKSKEIKIEDAEQYDVTSKTVKVNVDGELEEHEKNRFTFVAYDTELVILDTIRSARKEGKQVDVIFRILGD